MKQQAPWAIERQTFSLNEEERLLNALRLRDVPLIEFRDREFETDWLIQEAAVPRGSCYFVLKASRFKSWNTKVWGHPDWYACTYYYPTFDQYLLNRNHRFMSINEFCWSADQIAQDWNCERLFVRPNDGFKSFEGGVIQVGDIEEWRAGIALQQVPFHSKVLVAPPVPLQSEWRLQMVDGHVVGASQYKPSREKGAPADVIQFAETVQSLTRWPARAFVMDIALSGKGLAVVEVGCLLCTAFYESDPVGIVDAIQPVLDAEYRSTI